ncbi:hypothetical protein HanIR_Chr13g0669251 [Helianthus annuus]|nr:hypothetical protein HanIR_Chr13g0669251 [Helianthus annuus]
MGRYETCRRHVSTHQKRGVVQKTEDVDVAWKTGIIRQVAHIFYYYFIFSIYKIC